MRVKFLCQRVLSFSYPLIISLIHAFLDVLLILFGPKKERQNG